MSTKLSARLALFFIFGFLVLGAGFSPQTAAQTTDTQYFQGFETDDVWAPTQTVNRVPSGTNGIPSKTGAFHGEVVGSQFTNWGGYNNTFPTNGYVTTLAVYLNPAGPYTNDTRFDFSSAINTPAGTHRRDFVFNAGFYDDVIVPGMGDRFVISASNGSGRASSDPKNAARDPFVITAAGWYTLKHRFYDSGGGVLAVDVEILDAAGTVLKTWTLSDPSDIIGTTVGGNRYGWFANNEFPFVAVDDTERGNIVAAPATLVVNPTGTGSASDCNDTTTPASSTTIQGAVNAADPGDTIKVCPGVYPELVDVTKPLTILGAQSGVDARSPSRTGLPTTESVVTGNAGSSSFRIAADDVTIDGFTIQGNTDPNLFGAGVLIGANTEGTEIRNNIIQNNIVGLFAANDSSSNPTVISQNVFRNNNNPGPASGFGIYTDQFTSGGTLTNLLIDQNTFTGNNNGAIGLVSTLAGSQTNITISNNEFTVNGNAINVSTSTDLTITGNMIANSLFTQVFIDGSTGLNFSCNTVRDSASRGLRFADFGGGGSTGSLVNNNNFQNNTLGGIVVETGGHTNPLNAESNYYGSPSGPTHPNNPGGTGDAIIDPDGVVDFTPFLTEPANCSPALPRDCAQNSSPYLLEPDFTIASNPNCEYQYGNTATSDPDSPFTLYTFTAANDPVQGIDRRFRSPLDAFRVPAILGNRNATTTTYVDVEQDPDQLNLHPGGAGERSVLRFFVPQGGTYRIEGSFEGISTAGTTTDVLILRRTSAFSPSTELFSAEIQGYNDVETFDITLDFAAGEIIEFSVGTGNNGFSNDSTGLSGSITLVTPPTPTPTPTVTPSPSPTVTPVPSPTVTPVPSPTVTPVPSPTVTPTPSPTATPIPSPTVTPTPSPTATPTPSPTVTPTPTATPTPTPTPIPAGPPWEGDINRADPNVPDDGDGEVNNVDLFWYSEFAEGRHCPSEGVGGEFQRLDGNDSGGIDAGDYNYIFNVWLGLLPKVGAKGPTQRPAGLCAGVPPAPSESFATSSSGGFDSTMVRIASSSGQPGRTILVPIIVESAGNVRSAGFTINYDPAVLSFSPIDGFSNPDVLKGSGAGADQLIGVNSTDGSIVVGIDFRRSAGTDVPLPAGTRQVALLRFTINSDAAVGSSTPITLIPQTTVDASGKAMTNVTVQSGNISIGSVRSLSGRALSEDGRGIRGVTVILTDSDGNRKTVNTNSLGYYEFVDIEAEETYVISASSRRFRFLARTVTVNDSLTDIDLVAIE